MKEISEGFGYIGPDLNEGPLPAIFYFALSAEESLNVDPYNQPAVHLTASPIRVFSFDLPAHGKGLLSVDAIKVWAEDFARGINPITEFTQKSVSLIEQLRKENYLLENQVGVMGLSRGVFVACHVAGRLPYLRTMLGFAPLTRLGVARELKEIALNPSDAHIDLIHLSSSLFDRTIRFYIGNHDTRVGTGECYHFVQTLAEEAFQHQIRSPQIELFITPSIGHMGHGTSKEIFHAGADWLRKKLL